MVMQITNDEEYVDLKNLADHICWISFCGSNNMFSFMTQKQYDGKMNADDFCKQSPEYAPHLLSVKENYMDRVLELCDMINNKESE